MSLTYTASTAILDYNFGKTTYTVPSTLYMGLSTTTINADGTGATESTGVGAYARGAVTNNKTNFGNAGTGTLTTLTAITFAESSASWGTITYIAFWDALTAGNIWFYEVLAVPKTVQANTTVVFSVGALTVSMTN